MNPAIFEEARAALASGPLSLATLHERLKMAGSPWSFSQHHLLFLAHDGFTVNQVDDSIMIRSEGDSPRERLVTEIEEVVASYGGTPVPAKEIRKRLPREIVTTDAQIKAVVRGSQTLEIVGPGLIRKK